MALGVHFCLMAPQVFEFSVALGPQENVKERLFSRKRPDGAVTRPFRSPQKDWRGWVGTLGVGGLGPSLLVVGGLPGRSPCKVLQPPLLVLGPS